ncbi:MAG: hypothetical protein NUV93_03775 [Firmicutes bacterium]|jgi:hypothetical protein|nr:hypothetical protein [Bacillota bacterium]
MVSAVLASAAAALWPAVSGAVSGCPEYVLVVVEEANTKGLNVLPLGGDCPRSVEIDEARRSVKPLAPEYVPDRRTRCLLVYDVEFCGVRVFSDAHKIRSFPYRVELGRPITVSAGGEGSDAGRVAVADNTMRLCGGTLTLVGVDRGGEVRLVFEGEEIVLDPGRGWAKARVRDGSSVSEIRPGPEWQVRLGSALDRGCPVSKLTVFNHGSWRKERVAPCGP